MNNLIVTFKSAQETTQHVINNAAAAERDFFAACQFVSNAGFIARQWCEANDVFPKTKDAVLKLVLAGLYVALAITSVIAFFRDHRKDIAEGVEALDAQCIDIFNAVDKATKPYRGLIEAIAVAIKGSELLRVAKVAISNYSTKELNQLAFNTLEA